MRIVRLPALVALSLLLSACGGGGDGGSPTPPVPTPAAVAAVAVTVPSGTLLVGGTVRASALARDASGNTLEGRAIAWSVSPEAVARVDGTGLVTGVAPGQATITATSEGRSGTAGITVALVPVATIVITPSPASVTVGQTLTLGATTRDSAGGTLTGRTVRWRSSAAAATVDSITGVVRGVSAGTATITATSEGRAGTVTVTVNGIAAQRTGDSLYTLPAQWTSPELTIRAGGFIDFFFEGGIQHNAIFRLNPSDPPLPGAPADIQITANRIVRRVFPTAGEYPVNCTVHPGMISRIVVRP